MIITYNQGLLQAVLNKNWKKPKCNQERTIQRNWKHRAHKKQDEDKQSKNHNTENYNDEQHEPHQKPGGKPRQRIPASNDELVDHYWSSVFRHLAGICTIHNIIKDD